MHAHVRVHTQTLPLIKQSLLVKGLETPFIIAKWKRRLGSQGDSAKEGVQDPGCLQGKGYLDNPVLCQCEHASTSLWSLYLVGVLTLLSTICSISQFRGRRGSLTDLANQY